MRSTYSRKKPPKTSVRKKRGKKKNNWKTSQVLVPKFPFYFCPVPEGAWPHILSWWDDTWAILRDLIMFFLLYAIITRAMWQHVCSHSCSTPIYLMILLRVGDSYMCILGRRLRDNLHINYNLCYNHSSMPIPLLALLSWLQLTMQYWVSHIYNILSTGSHVILLL